MVGTLISSDIVAIIVLLLFASATLSDYYTDTLTQYLMIAAWTTFAFFWLNLIEHFAITQLSAIEGLLATLAVPACLYVAYTIYTEQYNYILITRAVTVMGLIYFPILAYPPATQLLIETVAGQVNTVLNLFGYTPGFTTDTNGYQSTFVFLTNDHRYITQVVLACSGLGSLAIIAGLIAAVRAPPLKKLTALTIALPIIWTLNLFRVAFIAVAHGNQWLRIGVDLFATIGITDPNRISYLLADRVIAQSLSAVALVALTLLLVRLLPQLGALLNEVIEPFFGTQYDFESLFTS